MTQLTLRYNDQTERIEQTYWRGDDPDWGNEIIDGTTVTATETTQQARADALESALNSVEAGTDYDAETETSVAHLHYDASTGELYGEVEIVQTD